MAEDPWEEDLWETELQKEEMLNLLVEKRAHIKEIEVEMENMIKEKEKISQLAVVPFDVPPITSLL